MNCFVCGDDGDRWAPAHGQFIGLYKGKGLRVCDRCLPLWLVVLPLVFGPEDSWWRSAERNYCYFCQAGARGYYIASPAEGWASFKICVDCWESRVVPARETAQAALAEVAQPAGDPARNPA